MFLSIVHIIMVKLSCNNARSSSLASNTQSLLEFSEIPMLCLEENINFLNFTKHALKL